MSDAPIIFSGPMVRALLDGRKTMTRRLAFDKKGRPTTWSKILLAMQQQRELEERIKAIRPGDRLWVRETVKAVEDEDFDHCVHYEADRDLRVVAPNHDRESEAFGNWWNLLAYRSDDPDLTGGKLVPPIHMPRWASRLTLVVTATRIERLQDISEADARAEGIAPLPSGRFHCGHDDEGEITCKSAITAFGWLWNSLHGVDAWMANPEVVALSFTVHKINIDQMKEAT